MNVNPPLRPLLTRRQVAILLNVSTVTLARWASLGKGPALVRIAANRTGYREEDVAAWTASKLRGGEMAEQAAA